MKYIVKTFGLILLAGVILTACEKEFANVNAPSDNQIFTDKDGLIAASVGLVQHFSTSTLSPIVEIPGLTTREMGNTSTYITPMELTYGGTALSGENAGVIRLWSRLLRDKGMAETILANVDGVELEAGTRSGISAFSKFMKAISLGYLVMNYEQAPINNGVDIHFSDRTTVLNESVDLLTSALADITANPVSSEFQEKVIPTIHLENSINAFLARYNLYLGNYTEAIDAADLAVIEDPLLHKSEWWYDASENQNPVYGFAVNDVPDTKPRHNFGIMVDPGTGYEEYVLEAGDGRLIFYMDTTTVYADTIIHEYSLPEFGGYEVHDLLGFFGSADTKIPVYLPGEMLLIKAEAYAKQNQLVDAVAQIDLVRQKTDDVFGVNAGLGAWTGNAADVDEIMDEIYIQRCIELFMTGQRFEDSRRIHSSFVPSNDQDILSERNRNLYPYSYEEVNNNSNCPDDPGI